MSQENSGFGVAGAEQDLEMSRTSMVGLKSEYTQIQVEFKDRSIPKLLFYSKHESLNQACIKAVAKMMQIKVPASCLWLQQTLAAYGKA